MPSYLFCNPDDESKIVEVVMSVHDKHELVKDGKVWNRIFTIPSAQIDAKLDANDPKSFVRYTSSRRGTVGEIMDLSAECSEKRAGQSKQDPVKQKFYENYSQKRKGQLHPEVKKQKSREKLKKLGITITD